MRPTIAYCGEKMSLDPWSERIAEEQVVRRAAIVESQRVLELPPFENALEAKGSRTVARAFVIEKRSDGEISVLEGIHGRVPSDPEEYLAESSPSGRYLVGSLAPRGGYSVYADRSEERFCLRLTDNGYFLHGDGVSRLLWLEDVKQQLAQAANKRWGNR